MMGESKHTPGPLHVSRAKMPIDGEYDYAISAIIDGRPVVIAECFGRVSETGTPDAAANAALYAAAPDLLEALKQVMGWIDGWDPNFTHDGDWPEAAHHMKAAIAKAEGRPNG